MAKRTNQLSPTFVARVNEPGRYGDGRGGHGLSLLVKRGKYGILKSWAQRIRVNERESNVGLGAYPIVTLAEARDKALANRRLIAQGGDPRTEAVQHVVPTFEDAARSRLALQAFKHDRQAREWWQTMECYVLPKIGGKLVSDVSSLDVVAVLSPIWTAKPPTARKVRQRIGLVMDYAIAKGYRTTDNPTAAVAAALGPQPRGRTHHAAMPHQDVAAAFATLRGYPGSAVLAAQFAILTATRIGEVVNNVDGGARWSEIDGDVWTIPAARTKTNREHRVPLSRASLDVLDRARTLAGSSPLVFPGRHGKPMARQTPGNTVKRAGVTGGTLHGFRSSFRDWCSEAGVQRELAERALGHVVKSAVEAAYLRTDLLDQRRAVMEDWGAHCDPS